MLLNRESAAGDDILQWGGIRKLRCTTLTFSTLEKQRQAILCKCDASPAYIRVPGKPGL